MSLAESTNSLPPAARYTGFFERIESRTEVIPFYDSLTRHDFAATQPCCGADEVEELDPVFAAAY